MPDFSYQLYSSRRVHSPKSSRCRNAGGYSPLYADEAKVKELTDNLHASGLKIPTDHFGLDMLEQEHDRHA